MELTFVTVGRKLFSGILAQRLEHAVPPARGVVFEYDERRIDERGQ
jgi:hypothetical protein